MHRNFKRVMPLLTAVSLIPMVITGPASSITLGTKVLRGAAIGVAVNVAAKPLNSFINTVTLHNKMKDPMATKVVPILSVGERGYVGGAQVSGPSIYVNKVKAVFQYEKNISTNNYRVKVLLPSASLNPLQLERVPKVGVSAIIDVAVGGRYENGSVGSGIKAGDVLRNAAVLVAVKNLGSELNKGINLITFNKGTATKVVPMASVGEKAYVGAAQISASAKSIESINALWQYDDLFDGGKFRVKVLVPTTSSNPLKMKRVGGAGVTAIIDMAVERQQKTPNEKDDPYWKLRNRYFPPSSGNKNQIDPRDYRKDDRDERHDNGLHKGWYKGKHKGWDKQKDNKDDRKDKARLEDQVLDLIGHRK
jgi:hypothetical protein